MFESVDARTDANNKGADQPAHPRSLIAPLLLGTDQPAHPCSLISTFVVCCLDSIIPLLAKSKISEP